MLNITMALIDRKRALTIFFRSALFAALVFGAIVPVFAEQGKVYTIAVIPSAPPVTLHKQWMPFVERLSRETGLELSASRCTNGWPNSSGISGAAYPTSSSPHRSRP